MMWHWETQIKPMRRSRATRWWWVLLASALAFAGEPTHAAWLSEVLPDTVRAMSASDPAVLVDVPAYLEIGLQPGHSGRFDIVLAQATPGTRRGSIIAVWTITPSTSPQTSPQTHMLFWDSVNQPAWPGDFLPDFALLSPMSSVSTNPLRPDAGAAQSLILFEGDTGLTGLEGGNLITLGHGSAVRWDTMTFGPAGTTAALYDETPLASRAGDHFARPINSLPDPLASPMLVGEVTSAFFLTSDDEQLRLNPGQWNLTSSPLPTPLPEPGTLVLILAGLGLPCRLRRVK